MNLPPLGEVVARQPVGVIQHYESVLHLIRPRHHIYAPEGNFRLEDRSSCPRRPMGTTLMLATM